MTPITGGVWSTHDPFDGKVGRMLYMSPKFMLFARAIP